MLERISTPFCKTTCLWSQKISFLFEPNFFPAVSEQIVVAGAQICRIRRVRKHSISTNIQNSFLIDKCSCKIVFKLLRNFSFRSFERTFLMLSSVTTSIGLSERSALAASVNAFKISELLLFHSRFRITGNLWLHFYFYPSKPMRYERTKVLRFPFFESSKVPSN